MDHSGADLANAQMLHNQNMLQKSRITSVTDNFPAACRKKSGFG
jgi:hypothetical protein